MQVSNYKPINWLTGLYTNITILPSFQIPSHQHHFARPPPPPKKKKKQNKKKKQKTTKLFSAGLSVTQSTQQEKLWNFSCLCENLCSIIYFYNVPLLTLFQWVTRGGMNRWNKKLRDNYYKRKLKGKKQNRTNSK